MRAITLTQPWATLVAIGEKSVETRDWATAYRGPLLIHAAKSQRADEKRVRNHPVFENALRRHGYLVAPLPLGAIVGAVSLIDCVRVDSGAFLNEWADRLDPREWEFGNLEQGHNRVAWILGNARQLAPFPWRGALSLWEFPDDRVNDLRQVIH